VKENVYNFDFKKLNELLDTGSKEEFNSFLTEWGLEVANGKVIPKDDWKKIWKDAEDYWDKNQLVKKILLNSAYGGILNPSMKFFDQRIGQSTTLSGRTITKHMAAKANELVDGNYDHCGTTVIANDTDSNYFSLWPLIKNDVAENKLDWSKDKAIQLYNDIAEAVNATFADYLNKTFNVPINRGNVIKAGREIVASNAYFIKKKRYALLYFDKDGKRYDLDGKEGKIKITGLDIKRADTPGFIKEFLLDIVTDLLYGKSEVDIIDKIRKFRDAFLSRKPWEKGVPKSVNNVSKYLEASRPISS
jgi:DNA polymerase elongation subunit (family B)